MPVRIAYIFSESDFDIYFIDRFRSCLNRLQEGTISAIDQRSVQFSDSIEVIEPTLNNADIVLVFVSHQFRSTAYFQNGAEIQRISERYHQENGNMELIPILLESLPLPVSPLPNVGALPRDGSVAFQASTLSPGPNSYSVIYERVVQDIERIANNLLQRRAAQLTAQPLSLGWILFRWILGLISVAVASFVAARVVQSFLDPPAQTTPSPTLTPTPRPRDTRLGTPSAPPSTEPSSPPTFSPLW